MFNKNKTIRRIFPIALVATAVVLFFNFIPAKAVSNFNKQINYQGKLTDASNQAVADGTYNMEFKLYATSTGGSPVWTESETGAGKIQVTNGLFSVMLGASSSLASVDFNQTLYLSVNIGGTSTPNWDGEMTPRKVIGAVPAAFEADKLDGIDSLSFLRSDQVGTTTASSSDAVLTVQQNGSGGIMSLMSGSNIVFTVLNNGYVGIGTSSPSAMFTVGATSTQQFLVNGLGVVTGGTWNGTVIGNQYGGTGQDSSAWTGLLRVIGGTWGTSTVDLTSASDVSGVLGVTNGGTGTSTVFTAGSLVFAGTGGSYNQSNPDLFWDNTNKYLGIGTSAPMARLDITGTSTSASVSTEMISDANDRTFSAETGNWATSSTWMIYNGVMNHATSSTATTSLSNSALSAVPAVGNIYVIGFNVNTTVAGTLTMSFGGTNGIVVGKQVNSESQIMVVVAANTNPLKFTPNSSWIGTLDTISIKEITPSQAVQIVRNSNGSIGLEVRAGGSSSVYIGVNSGRANSTGVYNVALGNSALASNGVGGFNVAIGYAALGSNTSGNQNSSQGYQALYSNTTGSNNSGLGNWALTSNTSGSVNSAFGSSALYQNIIGSNNMGVGASSLFNNIAGSNNVAIGVQAGYGASQASQNNTTLIGYKSGYILASSTGNVFIGYQAGDNVTTGSNNMIIGNDINGIATSSSNTLNIGNLIFGNNVDGTQNTLSTGNVGIGTTSPSAKLDVWGNLQVGTSSDPLFLANTATGFVGIGTSSPNAKLTVWGTGTTTARLVDFSNSAGTNLFTVLENGNIGIGTTSPDDIFSIQGIGMTNLFEAYDATGTSRFLIDGNGLVSISNNLSVGGVIDTNSYYSILGTPIVAIGAVSGGVEIGSSNSVSSPTGGGSAIGDTNNVTVGGGVAIGSGNTTNESQAVAIGYANTANGVVSTAIGANNTVDGLDSMAFGYGNSADGTVAIAVGSQNTVTGGSVAIGKNLTVSSGMLVGLSTVNSMAISTTGLFGFGTTSPTSKIHALTTGAKTADYTGYLFSNTTTSVTANKTKTGVSIVSTGSWNGSGGVNRGLYVNVSGGESNYSGLFTGGNFGIGTTSPSQTLDVWGNLQVGTSSVPLLFVDSATGKIGVGTSTSNYKFSIYSTDATENLFQIATSTNDSIMVIGANGNIGFGTSTTASSTAFINTATGAWLSTGGSWTNASDRNVKENFVSVDPQEILSKINQLTIDQWNYIAEASSTIHIGPVAQDFYALFGLGGSDTSISTIDPAGVALVGIKALSARMGNNNFSLSFITDEFGNVKIRDIETASSSASTTPAIAVVEVGANSTSTSAFAVKQSGTGNIAEFYDGDVAIMTLSDEGTVMIVGNLLVDGRIMVCPNGVCNTNSDSAVIQAEGDIGVSGKVVAGAFEGYCESGYIWVPGSAKYGTMPGFCAMADKARMDIDNKPTASTTTAPWFNITQGDAQIACETTGKHLLGENEWLTIAENILSAGANDIDTGTAGMQLDPTALAYQLNSSSTISSLSGMTGEWTSQTVTAMGNITPTSTDWIEYQDVTDFKGFNIMPPYYYNSANGIGKILTGEISSGLIAFVRGYNGIYGLDLTHAPTEQSENIGFRCAK